MFVRASKGGSGGDASITALTAGPVTSGSSATAPTVYTSNFLPNILRNITFNKIVFLAANRQAASAFRYLQIATPSRAKAIILSIGNRPVVYNVATNECVEVSEDSADSSDKITVIEVTNNYITFGLKGYSSATGIGNMILCE